MKTRIISAIIAIAIAIPIVYFGGYYYRIAVGILTAIGYTEFLMAFEHKKTLPNLVKIIAYLSLFVLFTGNVLNKNVFNFDYKYLLFIILMFLVPVIFYHDDKTYNTDDALYLIGGTLFLSLGFSILYTIRENGYINLLYLVTITVSADTFAYFTGKFLGKHKMIPSISPNKTWEGALGGTIISTLLGTLYYANFISDKNILCVIGITLLLSIIGQIGDLIFSAMKRRVKIKDFSNIMPGHGGILDRFDSLILVLITYMLFL